jgi:hypothetical protein
MLIGSQLIKNMITPTLTHGFTAEEALHHIFFNHPQYFIFNPISD